MLHYCQTQVKIGDFHHKFSCQIVLPSMATKMVTAWSAVMTV